MNQNDIPKLTENGQSLSPETYAFLYASYLGVSGRKFGSDISIPQEMVRNTLRSLELSLFKFPRAVFPPAVFYAVSHLNICNRLVWDAQYILRT